MEQTVGMLGVIQRTVPMVRLVQAELTARLERLEQSMER